MMLNTLLGTKKGMVSGYDARGRRVGATVLEVSPNVVTQIKTLETKDGYNAVQIGSGQKKSVNKPQIGHLKKVNAPENTRWLREVRVKEVDVTAGQQIKLTDIFAAGDSVKVTGISKGKGFQGGVKRHGFAGGPKTHGQSDRHRAPGSIGSGTTPGRVYKGKSMAGHMGVETVSYTGLEVLSVDKLKNLITIKGGVPGAIGGLVILEKQGKMPGYIAPPEPEPEEEEEIKEATVEAENVETEAVVDAVLEAGSEK